METAISEAEKQKTIKREKDKITKLFKALPADKKKLAAGLIDQAAFMVVTLGHLQEIINREGPTDLFEQGEQCFIREHPAVKAYNTTVRNYQAVIKALIDLLPAQSNTKETDELIAFAKRTRR